MMQGLTIAFYNRLLIISVSLLGGFIINYVPISLFSNDNWLYEKRRFECDGKFYEKVLGIRKYKD